MNDPAPKVTRARMIIEFADGSARYLEAREPAVAEIKLETSEDVRRRIYGDGFLPLDHGFLLGDLSLRYGYQIEGATLRLTYRPDYHLRIERDSGEIPPELAEHAAAAIDAVEGRLILEDLDHPLVLLRPYLARIAGRTA